MSASESNPSAYYTRGSDGGGPFFNHRAAAASACGLSHVVARGMALCAA